MKEKVYVERLFSEYEDTPELGDFKEEVTCNLKERVKELMSKGYDEEGAFDQATAELGDITAIADEVGRKKRNEAFAQMYMGAKVPISKRTALGITIASGFLLIAVGMILISLFMNREIAAITYSSPIMLALACGMFTYFGLTQETAAHYPVKNSRAIGYGIVCLLGVLGAGFAATSFFLRNWDMPSSLIVKTALIIPAICGLIFLLATEKKRQKPWLKALVEQEIENFTKLHRDIVNPAKAAKFGVFSGGLWVLAIAVFATLLLVANWQFSWLVFIFAAAIQVFMVAMIFEG